MLRIDLRSFLFASACLLPAVTLGACKKHARTIGVGAGHDAGRPGMDAGVNGKAGSGSTRKDAGAISQKDGGQSPHLDFDAAGATMDAKVLGLDAALDLPDGSWILPDGAIVLPDGEIIDVDAAVMRYTPEIDVSTCKVGDNETWSAQVDISDEGGFSLVPGQTGFGLGYRSLGDSSCATTLELSHIPATFGFPEPHSALSDCGVMRDVSVLGMEDNWRITWVDNFTQSAELHTQKLDLDMNPIAGETRRQLTDNQLSERRPVMAEIAGNPIAAWISTDLTTQKSKISTQALDGDAAAIDVVQEDEGHEPRSLAIAQMGDMAGAIGWVGPAGNPGVWLLKIDAQGAAVGDPMQLTDKVAVSSSIDLANRDKGGAAIYSIEIDGLPQVRFRRLDKQGNLLADERSIVGPPLRAQGASLATIGGGYAVAYRALPDGDLTDPEVRLTFITKEGNTLTDPNGQLISYSMGSATLADARTYISVSVEGEIMVAWIDADPNSRHNLLKLVRRRLDCQ